MPHLWNRPEDIIYVPAFIAFGYYFRNHETLRVANITRGELTRQFCAKLGDELTVCPVRLAGVRALASAGPLKR
jgi:hypothetical protein